MSKYKGYTQERGKATMKHLTEHYEQLRVWVRKGEKERYKALAAARGLSLAEYIKGLIEEDSKRE